MLWVTVEVGVKASLTIPFNLMGHLLTPINPQSMTAVLQSPLPCFQGDPDRLREGVGGGEVQKNQPESIYEALSIWVYKSTWNWEPTTQLVFS